MNDNAGQREVFLYVPQELNGGFGAAALFTVCDQLILSTVVGTGCNLDDALVVVDLNSTATPDYDILIKYGGEFSVVFEPIPATSDNPHPSESFWGREAITGFMLYLDNNPNLKERLKDKKVVAMCESLPGVILASTVI